MNKLSWTNKQDGVDIVAASDINTVAGAVIDTQDELDNKADLVNGQVPASQLENAPSTTVEDTLTSTSATNALSAKQGKVLNEKVTEIESEITPIVQPTTSDDGKFLGAETTENWDVYEYNPMAPDVIDYTGAEISQDGNYIIFHLNFMGYPVPDNIANSQITAMVESTSLINAEVVDYEILGESTLDAYINNTIGISTGDINAEFYSLRVLDSVTTSATWKTIPTAANVIDNLNSDSSTDALSAKQGKVLNEKVTTQTNATIYSAKRVVDWDSATVLEQWSPTFISKSAVSTDKYYFLDLDFTGDIPYLQLTENCLQGSYLDGAVSVDGQQTSIAFPTHTILANTVNGNVATVILERKSTDTFEFTDKTVFSNIGIVDGDVFHIDVVWDETQNGYFTLLQKAREEIRNINEEIGDVEAVLDDLIGGDNE